MSLRKRSRSPLQLETLQTLRHDLEDFKDDYEDVIDEKINLNNSQLATYIQQEIEKRRTEDRATLRAEFEARITQFETTMTRRMEAAVTQFEATTKRQIVETMSQNISTEITTKLQEAITSTVMPELWRKQQQELAAFQQWISKEVQDKMDTAVQGILSRDATETNQRGVFETDKNLTSFTNPPTLIHSQNNQQPNTNIQTHFINPNITNSTPIINSNLSRIKISTYDGTVPWSHFESQFDIAAYNNQWTEEEKALQLAGCLRGKALVILQIVPKSDQKNFQKLKEALESRFDPQKFAHTYLNQLQARTQQEKEDFVTYAEEIERLTRLAHPTSSEESRDYTGCFHFINGLKNSHIENVLHMEEIKSLQLAVKRATEVESINDLIIKKQKQTNQRNFQNPFNRPNLPNNPRNQTFIQQSQNAAKNYQKPHNIRCFKCNKLGHLMSECRSNFSTNFNFNRPSNTNCNRLSNSNFNQSSNSSLHQNQIQTKTFYQNPNKNFNQNKNYNPNFNSRNQNPNQNSRNQNFNQNARNQNTNCYYTESNNSRFNTEDSRPPSSINPSTSRQMDSLSEN